MSAGTFLRYYTSSYRLRQLRVGELPMKKMIAILLLPALAYAGPGPVTRYLMYEPASLFDVGMIRLQSLTRWAESNVGFAWTLHGKLKPVGKGINAHYSFEDDRIYIVIYAMDEAATEVQMQEGCQKALQQLRIVVVKSLPQLFQHNGFDSPTELTNLFHSLVNMFELRCYVSGHDSSVGRFWATQSLDAEEMTIGAWEKSN
jgi:hypothetical protein